MSTLNRRRAALAFGAVLRAARQERGLTQEQLAEIGGLDRTYASLLERGLRTPTLSVLFRLADALGLEAAQLVKATDSVIRKPQSRYVTVPAE
jgi:transcriptional regulator with XRE-family HTH domain